MPNPGRYLLRVEKGGRRENSIRNRLEGRFSVRFRWPVGRLERSGNRRMAEAERLVATNAQLFISVYYRKVRASSVLIRVCTEEMDDLSQEATRLVIQYCLGILDESAKKIREKVSLARLEEALTARYREQCDNKVYQYHWALRHPVAKDAITKALVNRFPAR
jgi:hypothetical protein